MKKIACMAVVFITAFVFSTHAQVNDDNNRLLLILQSYFNIKDALVAGNNKVASENATAFIKNVNGISYKTISEGNVNVLLKDAGSIAGAKSIDKQREAFANFSSNMAEVAKGVKLSVQPVFLQYCPMKKAYWLSSDKAIRNPYYGSTMLTCGEVKETFR